MSGKNIRRDDWETLKPTIRSWGINDVNYAVERSVTIGYVNGKQVQKKVWRCPYYTKWQSMINRCFNKECQAKYPTYIGCTISEDWRHLSKFTEWVNSQPNRDWENCEPDKDLLVRDNKHYSPETVVFVNKQVNCFTLSSKGKRGDYMLGVTPEIKSKINPYTSRCNNPLSGKIKYCGSFSTEIEAHKAWQAKKHEFACQLADLQDDPRVAEALRQRYAPGKDWTKE